MLIFRGLVLDRHLGLICTVCVRLCFENLLLPRGNVQLVTDFVIAHSIPHKATHTCTNQITTLTKNKQAQEINVYTYHHPLISHWHGMDLS